jgi:hypothetical protein
MVSVPNPVNLDLNMEKVHITVQLKLVNSIAEIHYFCICNASIIEAYKRCSSSHFISMSIRHVVITDGGKLTSMILE